MGIFYFLLQPISVGYLVYRTDILNIFKRLPPPEGVSRRRRHPPQRRPTNHSLSVPIPIGSTTYKTRLLSVTAQNASPRWPVNIREGRKVTKYSVTYSLTVYVCDLYGPINGQKVHCKSLSLAMLCYPREASLTLLLRVTTISRHKSPLPQHANNV